MASLRNTFLKGVETIFKQFKDAVHIGTYNLPVDDGFSTPTLLTDTGVRCIYEKFRERDVELLTFYKLIQPKDIIGLVPYVDISHSLESQGYFELDSVKYSVIANDVDPMNVIYTVLLRKN